VKPLVERNLDWKSTGTLSLFDQKEFVESLYIFNTSALDDLGYVFIPNNCQGGSSPSCRVHVALHGCRQGRSYLDDTFVTDSGYLEWAGVNDIIVLFPQAKANTANPQGCWDWWGYTGADYASDLGVQPKAIKNMVDRLTTPSSQLSSPFSEYELDPMGDLMSFFTVMFTLLKFFF